MTKIGEAFYRQCARSLEAVDDAIKSLSNARKEPQGTLRIGATPFFGKVHLVPALLDFLAIHERVTVDISLQISVGSFHESGLDMLVRAGNLRGQRLVHEELAPIRHVICATPGYLKRHGIPKTPKDLAHHNCLLATYPSPTSEWPFVKDKRREHVQVSGSFRSDSVEAIYRAVMSGAGIARLSNYVVGPELRSGELQSLFPMATEGRGYGTTTTTMKAYYARSRHPDATIQAFVRFLKERFKSNYNWERSDNGP
jgi:DNA-binding transcriptional LysR family regulator